MLINVDPNESQVLREILQGALSQLRIESARTDSHDFRVGLHQRERVVETLLAKISDENSLSAADRTR